jgi:hypothetical protein
MARKPLEQRHRGFNTGAAHSTSTPTTCPVCGETPAVAKGEKRHEVMEAHLKSRHQPDGACQREHRTDWRPDWKLDWDAVLHQQAGIFYCGECGYYYRPAEYPGAGWQGYSAERLR